ncbi:MAG: RNB domain-containing ribonuclease, partial [Treponema sp.]|nr:RNB domain-containing ribonuclease [Treponema sp.]
MITDGALVVYKNKPSIVKDRADGKFLIALQDGTEVKVRDKDIELLHPGPVKNFSVVLNQGNFEKAAREVWELLLDDGSEAVPLKELASLVCGEYTPSSAYLVFCLLQDGLYFSGTISAVTPCKKENVAAEESKRAASMRELTDRAEFLERIKKTLKKPAECLPPSDARYMQDVEALACGKSVKSRTMKELGLGETPEDAHALLLKTNIWTPFINPHPSRFSISLSGAAAGFDAPLSDEQRRDLTSLASFAIDSPWSNDPDDAVSIDVSQTPGQYILYVHVADPASS